MKLQEKIEKYLIDALDGGTTISDEIIERFGERCKEALNKQFNNDKKGFTLRMSAIGKPLCQQQMEKSGAKAKEQPPLP